MTLLWLLVLLLGIAVLAHLRVAPRQHWRSSPPT